MCEPFMTCYVALVNIKQKIILVQKFRGQNLIIILCVDILCTFNTVQWLRLIKYKM